MGNGLTQLTPEQVEKLKQETPFSEEDLVKHLKRYACYDVSEKGGDGITREELLLFPEFSGHPFINRILDLYVHSQTKKLYAEKYLYMCAALSSKADTVTKTKLAFRVFDFHDGGVLQYEEVYTMFTMLFRPGSLTEDQLVDLTFRALNLPELQHPEEISFEDFQNVVSDGEIRSKFTIDLQLS